MASKRKFQSGDRDQRPQRKPKFTADGNRTYAATAIQGPGIFVTCARRKEKKAVDEICDFLNDVADRIYPELVLTEPPLPTNARRNLANLDEDDMDALRNGPPPSTSAPVEPQVSEPELEVSPAEDDVEAQIRAELEALNPARNKGKGKSDAPHNGKSKPKRTIRRFQSIETSTECLAFIRCAPPIDPYKMVYAILEEVERTGEARSRFVQRLSPVSDVSLATEESAIDLASRIMPKFFTAEEAKAYKVDTRIRSHSVLKRDDLIHTVTSCIPRDQGHRVELNNPQALLVVVEVFKNVCGIGVVRDYDRFKKFNLRTLAESKQAAGNGTSKAPDVNANVAEHAASAPAAADTAAERVVLNDTEKVGEVENSANVAQEESDKPGEGTLAAEATKATA